MPLWLLIFGFVAKKDGRVEHGVKGYHESLADMRNVENFEVNVNVSETSLYDLT